MNNYVYIIAGLPDFTPDWRQGEKSLDEYIGQVRELLSVKDNEALDFIVRDSTRNRSVWSSTRKLWHTGSDSSGNSSSST